MTRSVRYQPIFKPIFDGLKLTLHRARLLSYVVITNVIEMVEMVEKLEGRVGNRSVKRVSYVINIVTLDHYKIWSHFTRTMYFHSPSARDNTDSTR